jgi:hypothetical protein
MTTDRPVLSENDLEDESSPEIEVTEAMIEAGVASISEHFRALLYSEPGGYEATAAATYRAMVRVLLSGG